MLKARAISLTVFAGIVLTGCTATPPTAPSANPTRPAYDETGHGFGSGNVTDPNGATTSAATSNEMTAEADTSSRTGHGFGSGN